VDNFEDRLACGEMFCGNAGLGPRQASLSFKGLFPKGLISVEKYPQNAVFIIGGGHFGGRAARILGEELGHKNIFLVEENEDSLSRLVDLPVNIIKHEGIDFLVRDFPLFEFDQTIVPAIPVHLAFLWLKYFIRGKYDVNIVNPLQEIMEALPNTMKGSEGSVLASYADFICPDDCPEPEFCTVTGERRSKPLYERIRSLRVAGFGIHVLRSQQLAPGVGGYKMGDMSEMVSKITGSGIEKWILGTSCKCHGIITSFEIKKI
jgi:hypothetical protein